LAHRRAPSPSRALDDLEESTLLPQRKVLYQFSARGHELTQVLLGQRLPAVRDGVGAYYRSRPLLLSLGLPLEDALGVDHDARRRHERGARHRRGVQSAAQEGCLRAAGVRRRGRAIHARGGLGAGLALSRRTVLGDEGMREQYRRRARRRCVHCHQRFWAALNIATTERCRCCSSSKTTATASRCRRGSKRRAATLRDNLSAFRDLRVLDGDASNPMARRGAHRGCGRGRSFGTRVRRLIRLVVPRLSGHSGQDTQTYKSSSKSRPRNRAIPGEASGAIGAAASSPPPIGNSNSQSREAVARSAWRSSAQCAPTRARAAVPVFRNGRGRRLELQQQGGLRCDGALPAAGTEAAPSRSAHQSGHGGAPHAGARTHS
jgi:2-oxoisovalerate dehydrogenase E1 component